MTLVQSRQMLRGGEDSRYAPSFPGSPTVDDHPAEYEVSLLSPTRKADHPGYRRMMCRVTVGCNRPR
jgi:hypothetical protein